MNADKMTQANSPGIIIKDETENICTLIDISVYSNKNIYIKVFDKLSKYKDLEIEIQKICYLKSETVSVIVGVLVMIKTG